MTKYEFEQIRSDLKIIHAHEFALQRNFNMCVFFQKYSNDIMRKAKEMTIEEAEKII